MNADVGELPGYLEFLLQSEGDTGGLLTIPKGGVENSDGRTCVTGEEEDNTPRQSFRVACCYCLLLLL
jgi:hypothetical protein